MVEMDLIRSMEWLAWTKKAHAQGRKQEDIDRRAINRVRDFGAELSPEVKELYDDAIVDAFDSPRLGRPEECMTNACQTVILMATEEDWDRVLAYVDGPEEWREIWDTVRSTVNKASIEEIKALMDEEKRMDALASGMTQAERLHIMDMGYYNEAIRGYMVIAMQDAGFSREDISKALGCLHDDFDFVAAEDAVKAYENF